MGAPNPSLEGLQGQLEHVYLQLANLYGLPAAIKALGQLHQSVEGHSDSVPPATSSLAGSPSSLARFSVDGSQGDDPESEPERHTGERSHKHAVSKTAAGGNQRFGSLWRKAAKAAQKVADPWESRKLHELPMEHCVRHRYRADKLVWVTDDVLVKMEPKPFAAGAMRECFAMKKASTFATNIYHDWHRAQNCVAKRYKKKTPNDAYFLDVLVQMDAKLLGEEYNRTDPPKQVDIMQAAIIEFPDRTGSPVMAIEQLMTGDYVKYNSNSGFVLGDELLRFTPQAFSHFTWCWSKGQRICVDIQGVGDLYTDPQIHTLDGECYGDGNLGLRGIALFFRTHQCNALCARLHLKPFERCAPDVKAQGYTSDSSTRAKAAFRGKSDVTFVKRTGSMNARLKGIEKRLASPPQPHTEAELMKLLEDVPMVETPDALVHLEVARVYAEVVLLPELRPEEPPEDALKGALFHLHQAAKLGCVQALAMLARMHIGIDPANTSFEYLSKTARQEGELVAQPAVAWRAAVLAAERNVGAAAMAVAHGYQHCEGLAEGVLHEAQPTEALRWYRRAIEIEAELTKLKAAQEESEAAVEEEGVLPHGRFPRLQSLDSTILEGSENESQQGSITCAEPIAATAMERTQSQLTDTSVATSEGVVTAKANPPNKIPSNAFILRQRLSAEDEASALPHAAIAMYEIQAALGRLLMDQDDGKGGAEAAELFNQAAELASTAGKGKLAQTYFELAAQAEEM